jgi:hypothetical protein
MASRFFGAARSNWKRLSAFLFAVFIFPLLGYAHTLHYSTYLVGDAASYYGTRTVRLDGSGNVYVAGAGLMTTAANSRIGSGTIQFAIAKFSPAGSPLNSTWFTLSSNDQLSDLAVMRPVRRTPSERVWPVVA